MSINQPTPDRDGRNKLFYNLKNPLIFQSEKTKFSALSPRDTYILGKKDSEIYKMYDEGMKILKSYMKLDEKITIFSRSYWIE